MWMMAAQAGMSILGAIGSYKSQKAQYKAQKAMQEYRNKMARLSGALTNNAITTNVALTVKGSARQAVNIKRDEISTFGSAAVAAAAAGVRGRSVQQTLQQVQKNFAETEYLRRADLKDAFAAFDQERQNTAMQIEQAQDYTFLQKPSLGRELLGAAMKTASSAMSSGAFSNFGQTTTGAKIKDFFSSASGNSVANPNIRGTTYLLR